MKNAPVTGAFNKRDRSHPVDDANRVGADLNPLFGSAQREKPSVRANPFGGVPLGVERKGGVWIRHEFDILSGARRIIRRFGAWTN